MKCPRCKAQNHPTWDDHHTKFYHCKRCGYHYTSKEKTNEIPGKAR